MNKGSYFLLIELKEGNVIDYGKNSEYFRKGFYIYIGSAMKNLRQRVDRHICYKNSGFKKHWHIDSLLERGEIVTTMVIPSDIRHEEDFSIMISKICIPVKNFGATDCKSVNTNLYHVKNLDEFFEIARKALEMNWKEKDKQISRVS